MKTELTVAESQRLIDLGIDPKLASKCDSTMKACASGRGIIRLPESRPIFTLTDILTILPKEIGYDNINRYYILNIKVNEEESRVWYARGSHIVVGSMKSAPELIDVLNQLAIWCLETGHLKTEKK